jgi:lysophospholipase L1-like esterase
LGLCEIIFRVINFNYFPLDIGFNITPEYKIFRAVDGYYETKDEKKEVFMYQKFPIQKDKNEIRIFILGESSIYYLGQAELLKNRVENELFKNKKNIRIINIGGCSYGTNRLLLHMQEILDYEPDLVILYAGHNEFEEEFMRETFFKESFFSRSNDKLMATSKFYQFMSMLLNKASKKILSNNIKAIKEGRNPFFPPETRINWGKFTFDKKKIYRNYRNNVTEMLKIARSNNIGIVISTVAYNRMSPPFSPKDDSYALCLSLYKRGLFDKASPCFAEALDADLQPRRATETTNGIIREIASDYAIPLADIDRRIVAIAKNKIPGFDLLQDHCHLNSEGNKVLQEVFYETIKDHRLLNKLLTK